MRIGHITTYKTDNTYFTGLNKKPFPLHVIKHYGLNMETMVGYVGKIKTEPMPSDVDPRLQRISDKLEINWATHITKQKKAFK